MIVVRTIFVAKPGQASQLAAQFKSAAAAAGIPRHRVLTDLTGESNRVVFEHEVESVGEFESMMKDSGRGDAMRKGLKGYTDMYLTAQRELLQTA
ncbi:MAG: hypothetical protein U0167_12085 [bacterium]